MIIIFCITLFLVRWSAVSTEFVLFLERYPEPVDLESRFLVNTRGESLRSRLLDPLVLLFTGQDFLYHEREVLFATNSVVDDSDVYNQMLFICLDTFLGYRIGLLCSSAYLF